MNKLFCSNCNAETGFDVRLEDETYPVKGEDIRVRARVSYCLSCGEQVFNPELDNENLKEAYRLYRSLHRLLQPEEIKEIREGYGLSQTAFAKVLGFGEKTVARYENGSLQDEAQNNLMLLVKDTDNFEFLLERQSGQLTQRELQKARNNIGLRRAVSYSMNMQNYRYAGIAGYIYREAERHAV